MARSASELRSQLSSIELDESTFDGLGPGDVDPLIALLGDDQPWLAARAVHALSRIDDARAREALIAASTLPQPEVRVAVASAAQRMPTLVSDQVLTKLLADDDIAVRKFAVKSVSPRNGVAVHRLVQDIATAETNRRVRGLAETKLRSL